MNNTVPPSGVKEQKTGFITPRERLINRFVETFSSGGKNSLQRPVLLLVTALLLTLLVIPAQQILTASYKVGDTATTDVKANQDFLLEDNQLTERQRAEAEAVAPYVYVFNPRAAEEVTQRFAQALNLISKSDQWLMEAELQQAVGTSLGVKVSQEEFKALSRVWSDRAFLSEINRLARFSYKDKVIADKRLFLADIVHGAFIVNEATGQHLAAIDYRSYVELSHVQRRLQRMPINAGASAVDLQIIKGLLIKVIQPNLVFDREATDEYRQRARKEVNPVLFQIKKGELIVRKGDVITEEQATTLKKIYESRRAINKIFLFFGIFSLVLVLVYFPIRFARKNIRKFKTNNRDLLFLAYVTVVSFVLLKIGFVVANAMGGMFPHLDAAEYYYILPFAVGAMLVRIVLNSEVALVYCVASAPLVGLMFNNSLTVTLFALLGSVVGAHGVRQCTDRSTIYTAGLKLSVVNMALALSFQILGGAFLSVQTIYLVLFGFANGLLTAALVTASIPVIETFFQYTTNIKLLELANLNSPILRELMIRAPGTYHHSILVGNLVEAAAEAIGANPLLARVSAYYHDVGKISKPQYFIENVGGGENRHDKLSPNMSALILISHVKEGVELAKEKRLGRPIIDIIRQSHGTALISFFYQKAKKLEQPGVQTVDEREFRYPGPKPQTREAGIVMLADCVEAASRTLDDPTPARIQGMVQKIINNIFIDGQLDECELTLKNLHEIAKSFNGILAGIFHQRIDYPEPAYKTAHGGKKTGEDHDREPAKAVPDRDDEGKKGCGEDLKRLGICK